jgi:hypothetical protein
VGGSLPLTIADALQANIQKNAGPEDWRCREAATFVFGCILEGPSVTQLAQIVGTGLQFLLTATKDRSTQVRLTTMWTIGESYPDLIPNSPATRLILRRDAGSHLCSVFMFFS